MAVGAGLCEQELSCSGKGLQEGCGAEDFGEVEL